MVKPQKGVKGEKGKVIASFKVGEEEAGWRFWGGTCEERGEGKKRQYELGHRIMGKKLFIL